MKKLRIPPILKPLTLLKPYVEIRQCAFLEEVNVNHNLKETGILVFHQKTNFAGTLNGTPWKNQPICQFFLYFLQVK